MVTSPALAGKDYVVTTQLVRSVFTPLLNTIFMDNSIFSISEEIRKSSFNSISSDDLDLFPCVTLGDVIAGMSAGGDPIKPVSGEAIYDEDDSSDVDTGSMFGSDRFDCMEASRRLAASKYIDLRNERAKDAAARKQADIDAAVAASKSPTV